jgi:hypothetical protein
MLNYTYAGPTLLVVPLFFISLVNLFVAGPPLKTVVLNSNGPTYGARLSFMQLHVQGGTARFNLSPKDEMTHFFVITCYPQVDDGALSYDAQARRRTALCTGPAKSQGSDAPRHCATSEAGSNQPRPLAGSTGGGQETRRRARVARPRIFRGGICQRKGAKRAQSGAGRERRQHERTPQPQGHSSHRRRERA